MPIRAHTEKTPQMWTRRAIEDLIAKYSLPGRVLHSGVFRLLVRHVWDFVPNGLLILGNMPVKYGSI